MPFFEAGKNEDETTLRVRKYKTLPGTKQTNTTQKCAFTTGSLVKPAARAIELFPHTRSKNKRRGGKIFRKR